jgi:serine/threonine protein kinase/pimeloyl-ACP methyl ester carboxylesterase
MPREEALEAPEQGWSPPPELDGFRVIRQLGRGGMGQVFLAHDDVLDRPVALKFLAAADPKPAARERFLVEARAIARLQHPNVVGIYRVGDVGGRPYIAYELITGKSLDDVVKPMPWPRALDLVVGVARGLSAAHHREVLHRDIKPANVMLADSGEIKLLDFGLAKLLDGPAPPRAVMPAAMDITNVGLVDTLAAGESRKTVSETVDSGVRAQDEQSLTATGALLGTPLYMAPELWRGEPASAQSDVYALGLLLFELLSGRLPHEGLRPAEIAEAVQTKPPPPIRSLVPGLPQALADVVDRCVRIRREERFQTAEEARDALEAIRSLYRPFDVQADAGPRSITGADDALQIAASFARIAPKADVFTARVYELLFTKHPELRALFPVDMSSQRRKLFGALVTVVDNLRRPDRLVPLLEDLGRRHASYGVKPEHFDAVGEALIGAISEFDERLRDHTKGAWANAYAHIAEAMTRGLAHERATPAPGTLDAIVRAPREEHPPTRWARSGDVSVAYQVLGNGSLDLVLVPGWLTHLEVGWQWPPLVRFFRSLSALGRLVIFDGRGMGLSDRPAQPVLLEDRIADLRAVLDAAGVERAALLGLGEGAATCLLFAATHPERTRAIALYGGNAKATTGDGYPLGAPADRVDELRDRVRASWGEPLFLETLAPTLARDEAFRAFWARYLRSAAAPGAAIAHLRANAALDVRPVLPAVRVPSLVLQRSGDPAVPLEAGRWLASHIEGARLVELPGADHLPFVGDAGPIVDEVRRFLGHAARPGDTTWMLAAVVSLAERSVAPPADPDAAPPSGLLVSDRLALACEREIARFRGIELDGVGEGRAVAMFDGPARAVRFARAVIQKARALGVELGAGVSFELCRIGDADVEGAAVRLAPAIAAEARAGEVLVSDPVRALVFGAMKLTARGSIEAEGETVRLHAVAPEPA